MQKAVNTIEISDGKSIANVAPSDLRFASDQVSM